MAKIREFTCKGRIELSGVVFFVKATSRENAMQKAKDGQFEEYEINEAETVNWEMDEDTIEEN